MAVGGEKVCSNKRRPNIAHLFDEKFLQERQSCNVFLLFIGTLNYTTLMLVLCENVAVLNQNNIL
jgi:hypothetical protein